ncbi:serine carboxypeptidase [Truncatella angustata]|uniref:Carboxypeptidase n=1 Tax=Truncatella angustata TaxID=152316 RepID=A0A9P8RK71_9PEZI|nr:serine carboxypeptidase [Truncatella angustata]KAH6643429.1 serine carboxypeptidase [Truncatella angustata]
METYKEKLTQRAQGRAAASEDFDALLKRQTGDKFLTNKTEQFAVNSSLLPDLSFDIGESYAGLLPIGNSNDTDLFFWFFPSTNEAAKEEVVIWFTGGPGCSSMIALLEENGPFTWQPGTYKPQLNPWSWHHLSNVLWIDQPVGTGYTSGEPTYHNESEVADQFRGFWKNFVDTFGMHNYKVYVTGESYAGLYVPYVAGGMIDQNDTEYFDVNGIIVYDGVLSDISGDIVTVPFVDYWHGLFPFNQSFSENIHKAHESCGYAEYLDKYLVYPPSGQQPNDRQPGINDNHTMYLPGCDVVNNVFEAILDLNPCFNIYEVSAQCPLPYDPLGFAAANFYSPPGAPTIYFNRTEVKQALHVPIDTDWEVCKDGVFPYGDRSAPSSIVQIPKIIDKTQNVQLVHGILDLVLFENVTLLTIQNMTWGGQLGFQERPTEPLFVPYHVSPDLGTAAGSGVLGTAHTERGLTYSTVMLSGHEVPGFQPSVAYRQLEVLLGRVENLQSRVPFTTDTNNTAQPTEDEPGTGDN